MAYLGTKPSNQTPTYKLKSEFVATAGQTVFAPSAYTPGYIDVYRNGVKLGNADFTATNGTTVTLAAGASVGDLITFESVYLASIQNGIPATAGAVADSYIAGMTASKLTGAVPYASQPVGSVLQVVNSQTSPAQASTTSATYVTTGISASITPKFSTSKIYVVVTMPAFISSTLGNFTVYRNSTNLETVVGSTGFSVISGANIYSNIVINLLDTPATTASTTYTVYFKVQAGGTLYAPLGSASNTVTLMEIAG